MQLNIEEQVTQTGIWPQNPVYNPQNTQNVPRIVVLRASSPISAF